LRIAFVGKAGSGKTTLAMYLVRSRGFKRLSFATALKKIAQDIIFWRPLDKRRDRRFLQCLGEDARQFIGADVWIRWFDWSLKQLENDFVENIVVDDCRYLNEAQYLKDNGFVLIRVFGREAPDMPEHISETELEKISVDFQIDNGGSLRRSISQLNDILRRLERPERPERLYTFRHESAKAR